MKTTFSIKISYGNKRIRKFKILSITPSFQLLFAKAGAIKRDFRRINTLGVPLSPYEVLNGLFHGEYLRGLTVYVGQDRDALKVLSSNSRGKNQYRILQLLMDLKNLPKDRQSINDYVNSNQKKSFADDQREISKYIKFVREILRITTS